MFGNWLVRFLYGVIIVAILLVLFFGKKQERAVRRCIDDFALAFLRLANRVAPKPLTTVPTHKAAKGIMSAAIGPDVVGLYDQLVDALGRVQHACGRNARLRRQFATPLQEIFDSTRGFLVYCEHDGRDMDDEIFAGFLTGQSSYRSSLFKRISADAGEEFAKLNRDYPLA
ncbi:MAG: hypothetical protein LUC93_03355 [Planctomycetaceae bacterium]|nr:hypothetical protein [Planctomycetaceae bacterium]